MLHLLWLLRLRKSENRFRRPSYDIRHNYDDATF
jgi:hypothetical protein